MEELRDRMEHAAGTLRNPSVTAFRVVLLPETMALRETRRLVEDLRSQDYPLESLVINRVLVDVNEDCRRCSEVREKQREVIRRIREVFPDLEVREVPELGAEVMGLEGLRRVAGYL